MSSTPVQGSRWATLCAMVSFLLPLSLYVWTGTPSPTWLDSAEFLATGFALGSAHPPGHPVAINLIKFFSMIPIGSITFKGSFMSAFFAALSCLLTYDISLIISRKLDEQAPSFIAPAFALISAIIVAVSGPLWSQATRTEVYTLQLAIVLAGLLALIKYGLEPRGERDGRLLAAAGLAFGISLANHHLLSFLLLPGVIVLLTEDALASWKRTLRMVILGAIPAILTGLVAYAHLPLRARNAPGAVSLGAASDLGTMVWVISARAFQKTFIDPPTTSFVERLHDAIFHLATQIGLVPMLVALASMYFLIRQRWAIGMLLTLSFVATWMAQSWMGFDTQNPDVLGYLLVPVCVIGISAARLGPLWASIIPLRLTVRVGAATLAAAALLGNAGYFLVTSWSQNDISRFRSAQVFARAQLHQLPPRSVFVTEYFNTGFNTWAAQMTEGIRPDVSHFHFNFIGYPGYVQQVHLLHRDLQGILRAALARGMIDERELSALAQRRPVYLEPMLETPRNIQAFLLPRGLSWEASAEPLGITDVRIAAPIHFARWEELVVIPDFDIREEQTQRVVLWRLYIDALTFAGLGDRDAAASSVERGLRIAPTSPELQRLGQALLDGTGRLDVTPFLPGANDVVDDEAEQSQRPAVLDF